MEMEIPFGTVKLLFRMLSKRIVIYSRTEPFPLTLQLRFKKINILFLIINYSLK